MAQLRDNGARRVRLLARRLGTGGGKAAATGCLALLLAGTGVGVATARTRTGVVVERGDVQAPAAEGFNEQSIEDGGDERASANADAPAASGYADASEQETTGVQDRLSASVANNRTPVVVHVDGAVAAPGVYTLEGESPRVNDAVHSAGGLTGEADTAALNLAAPVADGQKVHVPVQGEEPVAALDPMESADAQASAQMPEQADAGDGTVNVNTATAEDLQRLPGVGAATAAAILEDRERNGPFSSPEDLMRVSGIGEKKLEKMRGMVRV